MIPESLEHVLKNWDGGKKRPNLLYIIPTGQNPSGSTLTLERKKKVHLQRANLIFQIYELCREHDLIICEDDPYYHLQLPEREGASVEKVRIVPNPSHLGQSQTFLSMDVDGRVLRFDSMSKIISGGLRMGWVTGPKYLVERVQLDQQSSGLHPSGISQVRRAWQH